MTKFVAVIFPDEGRALEGRQALDVLNDEGRLTLYAAAVVVKDAEGNVSVKHRQRPGPLGLGLNVLLGGLAGLLAGPAVAAFGATAAAVAGGWSEVVGLGARREFLEDVSRELMPGKSAVLAEVTEDQTSPLDLRMAALGGLVLREPRPDFEEDRIAKEATAEQTALTQLEAEHRECEEEIRAKLKARIAETHVKLKEAAERAKASMERLQEETDAKIAALEAQAGGASADLKARIERRMAEIRADHERRSAKLRQAWELTREALE